jgi:hypothetical protein
MNHLRQGGNNHRLINVTNMLDDDSFQQLRAEVSTRIRDIDTCIADICSQASAIARIIVKNCNDAVQELQKYYSRYLSLIKSNSFDDASYKEVQNILKTKMNFISNKNIANTTKFEYLFDRELIMNECVKCKQSFVVNEGSEFSVFELKCQDCLNDIPIRLRQNKRQQLAGIDFRIWEYKSQVFLNSKHEKFNVSIFHFHAASGEVALKEYTAKMNPKDLAKMDNEIYILTKLSARADPAKNCFLKYFGSQQKGNKLTLYMEYHKTTLMEAITAMKNSNKTFSEEYLTFTLPLLFESFAEMEILNIYHQDIKPHNILYTDEGYLKIIDFSISSLKTQSDATVLATGLIEIQGTVGYMAPELEESYRYNEKKAKYRKNKADVFSLGITILQMCTLENLMTLNQKDNHERLMEKVNSVRYEWLKTLLTRMLKLNYNLRPTFKECLLDMPRSNTLITE